MISRRNLAKSLLGAVFATGLGTAAHAQFQPAPPPGPPPPYPQGWQPPPRRYEPPPPPPPGVAFVWVPGHWRWGGNGYFWVRGRYMRRQAGWHRWVDGRWAVVYGRWTWIPGHWS